MKLSENCKADLKVKFKDLFNSTFDNALYSPISDAKAKCLFDTIEIDIGRSLTEIEIKNISQWYSHTAKATICCESLEERDKEFNQVFIRIEEILNA